MKSTTLLIVALAAAFTLQAQLKNVVFSYSENMFENGLPLPAEEKFIIKGRVAPEVDIVTVSVHRDLNADRKPFFTANWLRGQDEQNDEFTVLMHQKLRQDSEYDFRVRYYRKATQEERVFTSDQLKQQAHVYLVNSGKLVDGRWRWSASERAIRADLNNIINDGLERFTNGEGESFPGFSDNVLATLGNLELHTEKGRKKQDSVRLISDETTYFDNLMEQLTNEVLNYVHGDLYFAFDERKIQRYPTEKLKTIISISAGYGGVIFNGKKNNDTYGHAPYLGISVPFGNRALRKPFWNNLSLSTGVFLLSFKDNDGNKVSGPIIQRPFYLGMGYKFLRFVKVQGGVTLLETKVEDGNFVDFDKVYFRPYVGIGLEFNFWMDLAK